MDLSEKFGHSEQENSSGGFLDGSIYHLQDGSNHFAKCNKGISICCCQDRFSFNMICKRCWRMLPVDKQKKLIHYFSVLKLKDV